MQETCDHAHLAIFDPHGGCIETKRDDILPRLRHVLQPEAALGKAHKLLSINVFKAHGVDFEDSNMW